MKAIVITHSESQVKSLHEKYWGSFDNIGFLGFKQQDFDKEWHWVINGKELSGTSGYNSLTHTINTHPGFKIFPFNQLPI